ncbi:MAG TPA: hypothetical protein PLD44_06385 [Paludibacteraceae bacterium]|nr:hypothetical protein [Paludibacteraceae bacterium]
MKRNFLNYFVISSVMVSGLIFFTACDDKSDPDPEPTPTSNEVILNSDITGTRNLVNDSVYILQGQVNVSGTINIEKGTIIKGDKLTKGCLVVLRGGVINAIGTPTEPIVFTSRMEPGLRNAGDWGGIIIVGNAPVNQSNPSVEGLTREVTYGGGTNPADNSGSLRYVRIEFAGIALQPDKEINGLTLCAVGSGTTIDHIQVSYSGDDSFEWFGGTVNAKYLIAYCGLDDEFDTDFGYSGRVQFALGVRNPRVADVSTSNGFESDNDGSGTGATPQTSAVFSNVTLIGPYKTTADKNVNSMFGAGMHIRRNSSISVFNSVFAGWNTGLLLDGTSTYANATAGNLVIQNCVLSGTKGTAVNGAGGVTADQALTFFNSGNNQIIADNATTGIASSFYDATKTGAEAAPTSFLPAAGSPLLSGASFTHAKLADNFFDKTPTFKGAFGTTDWTKEQWTNFDPQNTVY